MSRGILQTVQASALSNKYCKTYQFSIAQSKHHSFPLAGFVLRLMRVWLTASWFRQLTV